MFYAIFREAPLKLCKPWHFNRCNDHTEGVGDDDIKENYDYDDMTMMIIIIIMRVILIISMMIILMTATGSKSS